MSGTTVERYWAMGYWFAVGYWSNGRDGLERSSEFADYCAGRREEYEAGAACSLPSVPELWTEFVVKGGAS